MTIATDAIERVQKLLRNPSHWTVGHMAKSAYGAPCDPTDDRAVCWCAEGALTKCEVPMHVRQEIRTMSTEMYGLSLISVNDGTAGGLANVRKILAATKRRFKKRLKKTLY